MYPRLRIVVKLERPSQAYPQSQKQVISVPDLKGRRKRKTPTISLLNSHMRIPCSSGKVRTSFPFSHKKLQNFFRTAVLYIEAETLCTCQNKEIWMRRKSKEITENKMKMSNSAQTQQRTFNADGKFA